MAAFTSIRIRPAINFIHSCAPGAAASSILVTSKWLENDAIKRYLFQFLEWFFGEIFVKWSTNSKVLLTRNWSHGTLKQRFKISFLSFFRSSRASTMLYWGRPTTFTRFTELQRPKARMAWKDPQHPPRRTSSGPWLNCRSSATTTRKTTIELRFISNWIKCTNETFISTITSTSRAQHRTHKLIESLIKLKRVEIFSHIFFL